MTKDRPPLARNWIDALRQVWSDARAARRERDRARLGVGGADRARRQFRWAEAATGYRTYLASHPADAGIVVRLIQTLVSAGELAEAREALQTGLDAAPLSPALARAGIELAQAEVRGSVPAFDAGAATPEPPVALAGSPASVLRTAPGVTVRAGAGAWLDYALATTGAVAVYADHWMQSGQEGREGGPVLFGAAHIDDLATTPTPPAMALFSAEAVPVNEGDIRQALIDAFEAGPVLHLPLILADAPWSRPCGLPGMPTSQTAESTSRILAIVPTRDEGEVLKAMIDSLRATARHPNLIDIVVVDNGSRDPETLSLLNAWQAQGLAEVLRIDEPFNWSHLNNRAAAGRTQDLFLFINNDMVMLSQDWDARLRAHLSRPDAGVVGARLIYPAGNIQHAGMALGVLDAAGRPLGPLHEGLGASGADRGPIDRWVRSRPAAAVTGAFMAVRRAVFERAGGFDATTFPVSCNDVDFCLRVRALGLTVLYAADIELVHDESHTRGHDDDPVRQARADAEKAALIEIWGDDAQRDPSRSPWWVAHQVSIFHGLRAPSKDAVMAEIARGADVWRTNRRQAPVRPNRP
ncbi:MAG: glycosyltransferase [Brevundimonas sp.]|uniref:glycosyltransferase n=1 Tax=Brevundimonas sp. TaxID=1871086 RepID=UPI0040332186